MPTSVGLSSASLWQVVGVWEIEAAYLTGATPKKRISGLPPGLPRCGCGSVRINSLHRQESKCRVLRRRIVSGMRLCGGEPSRYGPRLSHGQA